LAKKQAAEDKLQPALNTDDITDRAFAKFGPKLRDQFSRGEVREVVAGLDLRKLRPSLKVPRLVVRWLRFTGTKTPTDKKTSPIDYAREFAPGVNVILIEDNLVGKSTILKTIKFALTGDDGDYDDDVKGWIKDVWLRFTLDDREFTVLLARREDGLHGALVPGKKEDPIEDLPAGESSVGFRCKGAEDIQAELRNFFVHEFKLASVGWTQAHPSGDGRSSECWATWQTFFQALRIPDDDHTYLLCKPDPGLGNQEQLLFSAFLGLHLIEPLNKLSMEASSMKKKSAAKEEDADSVAERKRDLARRRKDLQSQLTALDDDLNRRLSVLLGGDLSQQIVEAEADLAAADMEAKLLGEQLQNLKTQVLKQRATARRLREQIALSSELSGIEVSLCPHCTQGIHPSAVDREREFRKCRVCAKQVPEAPEAAAAILEGAAVEFEQRAEAIQAGQNEVADQLAEARRAADAARRRAEAVRAAPKKGVSAADLARENEARGSLNRQLGAIDHELSSLDRTGDPEAGQRDKRAKIIERVQAVLKEEAEAKNEAIHKRLNELVQPVVAALRAHEIGGVTCSPMGVVRLTKGGKQISFTKIKNPGERFRAKLALYLAMMQLGCEPGFGRHPGFLLIDQLGTAEIVPVDLEASAAALKHIDDNFGEKVQIICCTARPEFKKATAAAKIYGPTAPEPRGKKYAF
jgi:hypothetical protein